MDPFQLRVYIWMYLNYLSRDGSISRPEVILDFSNAIDSDLISGSFVLKNFTISGFETLVNDINNIQSGLDYNGHNNGLSCRFLEKDDSYQVYWMVDEYSNV
ncbi:hypothetical protein NQ317_005352 [Molorchus minor]|uniref:Uncharacterized protein n=1 Tax=Molorchus minor TaxID=1323400 RepID=A0ABQ9JPV7_9CUCU|nr:hypothetical protein NQ317_005352 [Molorchus minor]